MGESSSPKLLVDEHAGMAWEESPRPIVYDDAYFDRYQSLDHSWMGAELTRLRLALVNRHLPCELWSDDDRDGRPGPHRARRVTLIDVGIGGGRFLREACRAGYDARGYDVSPRALSYLSYARRFADPYQSLPDALTLWD